MDISTTLYRNILVPLDGSPFAEQVIPHVQALAAPDAKVTLLHVLQLTDPICNPVGEVVVPAEIVLSRCRQAAREDLSRISKALRHAADGITVDVVIVVGDPFEQIVRVATEHGADLIAMTSRGRSIYDDHTFSSVVDRVIRTTTLPTMIVQPDEVAGLPAVDIRRLIVPLDGSTTSAQALPIARLLAKRLHLPIQLISVIDPVRDAPPAFIYEALASPAVFNELFAGRQLEIQQMLEQAGARLLRDGIPAQWSVVAGPVVACILEAAAVGDLIVMTSHGRSGPKGWPIGSVAESLVRYSRAPLILLRATPVAPAITHATTEIPARRSPVVTGSHPGGSQI